MIQNFPSVWMTDEHRMLQDSAARFFRERWVPQAAKWREEGQMPLETWREAGANGLLCASTPAEYGGGGGDFGHDAVIFMESSRAVLSGFGGGLHSSIVAPYFYDCGTEEQKRRWLPKMATGELVGAIAMTEPGTGCDLQAVRTSAVRDGDHYVVNGSKTFITNGQNANLIIVVCKTDKALGAKGTSLVVVETDTLGERNSTPGFRRGRRLDKIGLKSQDTSELFFDDVRVPADNLIGGREGQGFIQLMQQLPQERLQICLSGIGRDGARARRDARLRERAQGLRQGDLGVPEHALQARRGATPSCWPRAPSSTPAWWRTSRASSTRRAPRWPSPGSPSSRAR